MKRNVKPPAVFLWVFLFAACASQDQPREPQRPARQITVHSFEDLQGMVWKLAEVRTGSEHIVFDRDKLKSEESDTIFTIQFDDAMASGEGAPNKYRSPYQLGEGQALSFGNAAATLMANIGEPEKLRERLYFELLGRVTRWAYTQGRLELYSSDDDGQEAVLAYILD
jgi:heat shock protein HslJ